MVRYLQRTFHSDVFLLSIPSVVGNLRIRQGATDGAVGLIYLRILLQILIAYSIYLGTYGSFQLSYAFTVSDRL